MYIGAFDIGGTKTIVALADSDGKILRREQFVTDTGDCLRHLDTCCSVFRGFLEQEGAEAGEISGVGVTLPGIADREKGILLRAVYAGWHDIHVKEYLSARLGIEGIICENDVNACAVGELVFGLGKTCRSFGWMTVSTGVGGAVVCDGKLIRGAHGYAGEFGHLKVEYEHPALCPCGQEGCLEAHGSGTALGRMIREKAAADPRFAQAVERLSVESSGASCAKLAREGDQTAREIFERLGEYLGRGISGYVNILDPEAVVIGGGVAASLDLLMPGIRRAIKKYTFEQMQDVRILPTALGYDAALTGALAMVLQEKERAV